jgi:hypothetical protein
MGAAFKVSLASEPNNDVVVLVAHPHDSSKNHILHFTPNDWNQPQDVPEDVVVPGEDDTMKTTPTGGSSRTGTPPPPIIQTPAPSLADAQNTPTDPNLGKSLKDLTVESQKTEVLGESFLGNRKLKAVIFVSVITIAAAIVAAALGWNQANMNVQTCRAAFVAHYSKYHPGDKPF